MITTTASQSRMLLRRLAPLGHQFSSVMARMFPPTKRM